VGSTTGRLVRQDGSVSEVLVSRCSLKGCHIPQELPVGELVSVEFTDIVLLVGHVRSSEAGNSQILFTRIAG
jgi:hypothetical protein